MTEAPLSMPLSKIPINSNVWFLVSLPEQEKTSKVVPTRKNLFEIVMGSDKKVDIPRTDVKNKKHELYNTIVKLTESCEMTFYSGSLNDGKTFVDYITNALWTIDGNHSQINKAAPNGYCKPLPYLFKEIYSTEYNC